MQPQIQSSFTSFGVVYNVGWFDLDGELPNLNWTQVYVVGDVDGMVPVIYYDDGVTPDNLPGGRFEPGETVDQALRREIEEEINHEVLSWTPIGYQKQSNSDDKSPCQLRIYAKMRPIGKFVNDPGGNVSGHYYVPLDELNSRINYGEIGERIVNLVKSKITAG